VVEKDSHGDSEVRWGASCITRDKNKRGGKGVGRLISKGGRGGQN